MISKGDVKVSTEVRNHNKRVKIATCKTLKSLNADYEEALAA